VQIAGQRDGPIDRYADHANKSGQRTVERIDRLEAHREPDNTLTRPRHRTRALVITDVAVAGASVGRPQDLHTRGQQRLPAQGQPAT